MGFVGPIERLHISRIQPTMQSWNLDSLALQRWLENFVKLSSFLVSCCVLGLIFRESQIFNFGDFSERPAHFLTIFELLELPGPPNIARVRNWILYKNFKFLMILNMPSDIAIYLQNQWYSYKNGTIRRTITFYVIKNYRGWKRMFKFHAILKKVSPTGKFVIFQAGWQLAARRFRTRSRR